MVKYFFIASALRGFSITPGTRRLYRYIGNHLGQRRRLGSPIPSHYFDSADFIINLCKKHQIVNQGDRILEIGTGWVHWGATIIRLFNNNVSSTLFDVWDNRQLEAFKYYCKQFQQVIDNKLEIEPPQREYLDCFINNIINMKTFEEIYQELNFQYLVDSSGKLKQLLNNEYNLIISINVFEHIDRSILSELICDSFRLLKPGGYALHLINISDHISHYDSGASLKNYYKYSEKTWKRWFENKVQYINRVQCSEWLNLFSRAGFELIQEDRVLGNVGNIQIDPEYAYLSEEDRKTMALGVLYKKPV